MPMIAALTAAAALASGSTAIRDAEARETSLKAVMIYNFARFAAWPPQRFASAVAPVTLCVAPDSRLAPALGRLDGQPVGSRRLAVRLTSAAGAGCHIALLDGEGATPARISALHQHGVLTVGEGQAFTTVGAVGLVTVGRQVRFEVNVGAARQAGVSLSSQLLRLAVSVKS